MKRIGITTTIPSEFIFASGCVPVDLNNVFVANLKKAAGFIEQAETDGLPRTTCGWIKGMYGAAKAGGIDAVIAVSDGDCSHTRSLLEILRADGMPVIPFAYPYDRDRELLKKQMEKLADALSVTFLQAGEWMVRLDVIRKKLAYIDLMTWRKNKVSGFENHLLQVCASDMESDPQNFGEKVDTFINKIERRDEFPQKLRLAFIGVPPIIGDLYSFIESRGARVVFNEVQRQFTLPFDTDDIVERYGLYTYPYDIFGRIDDVRREIERRGVHGVIHYVQSFCHHQMEDIMFRKSIDLPFLTLEGDAPQLLDTRTKLRVESFCEILSLKTEISGKSLSTHGCQ
ncbi:MAG: 2-hydroxyglutaryl-CoA dehydratase [bacterium]|nr:MAG: 2-hydroxyglutaryl-CoA dehydratase [bacterium]